MQSTKISTRLYTGFGLVLLLLIIVTALGINRVQKIDAILTSISDVNNVKQRHAINFRGSAHDRAIALRDVVLAADAASAKPEIARIETLAANYAQAAAPLDQIIGSGKDVTEAERTALAAIKASEAKAQPIIAKVIQLRLADDVAGATALQQQQGAAAFTGWLASVNQLIDLEKKMSREQADKRKHGGAQLFFFMVLLCMGAIAIRHIAGLAHQPRLAAPAGGEPTTRPPLAGEIALVTGSGPSLPGRMTATDLL